MVFLNIEASKTKCQKQLKLRVWIGPRASSTGLPPGAPSFWAECLTFALLRYYKTPLEDRISFIRLSKEVAWSRALPEALKIDSII